MFHFNKWLVIMLSLTLAACTTEDQFSFTRLGQTVDPNNGRLINPSDAPRLSDGLALNYASSVASVLRARFNGARITNEVASTLQVTLAALAGAGAAFDFGASAVAALGLSSAGIPQLQRIFMAQGRIDAYQDAVKLIEETEIEYLAFNQYPSSTVLTQNGVTIFQRVTASIHLVEKTLGGRIPTLADTEKATEPMTQAGAVQTAPGLMPANNIPANGQPPVARPHSPRAPETVSGEDFRRIQSQLQKLKTQKIQIITFVVGLEQLDSSLSAEQKRATFSKIIADANLTGKVEPDADSLNNFYQDPSTTAADREALSAALKAVLNANGLLPDARGRSPRAPATVSREEFNRLQLQLEDVKKQRIQVTTFVDGLEQIDSSLSAEQKRATFSKIIADANLTGKVEPDANSLSNFYQDPNTSAADREALSAALKAALK
jgi:hypothetical protein